MITNKPKQTSSIPTIHANPTDTSKDLYRNYTRRRYSIETDELAHLLEEKPINLRVLNGTWYMPNENKDARVEHKTIRIPTSIYLDLDEVSDKNS
jgi:3-mercaptopyruvate sulfurtransferase SseA